MNIKSIWSATVAAGVTLVFASCGVQIQMETTVPAEVNLGKGTMLLPSYSGEKLVSEMEDALNFAAYNSGYYLAACDADVQNVARMNISDTYMRIKGEGDAAYADLYTHISFILNNRSYYNRYKSAHVYRDSGSRQWDTESACRTIAEEVMQEITPHKETYWEKVSPNDENSCVELGASHCAIGEWAKGRSYAEESIKNNPNDPEAHYLMGLIERYYKNYQNSTACFEKAYSIDPKSKYRKAIEKNSTLARNEEIARQQLND